MNSFMQLPTYMKNLPEELEETTGEVKKAAQDWLSQLFPNGHPEFLPTALRLMKLHSDKNHDYASGGTPLGNFERVGTIKALYPSLDWSDKKAVAVSYMLKQFDAALWGMNSKIKAKVEGQASRWQDVAVYAMIIMCMLEDEANEQNR